MHLPDRQLKGLHVRNETHLIHKVLELVLINVHDAHLS